jgi:GT2 family glycosyltransferase
VILAYRRPRELELVLERLAELRIGEVLVAPNSADAASVVAECGGWARLIEPECGENVGIAGRNAAARAATGEFLLFLDDDSYPLAGSIETMLAAFESDPRLGVVGGLVREVDAVGRTVSEREPGTFDWWLRAGARGEPPPEGFPTFFFPEGACMIRRDAFFAVGGFFEPYFLTVTELDLATRMIAHGWDVTYLPTAVFHHVKHRSVAAGEGRLAVGPTGLSNMRFNLRLRIRNQLWYFWIRFPTPLAARRIPAYLAFDLLDCIYRRVPAAWFAGIRDAWRERDRIRGARSPLPREVVRRAELNRGRMHLRLLVAMPWGRLRRTIAKRGWRRSKPGEGLPVVPADEVGKHLK